MLKFLTGLVFAGLASAMGSNAFACVAPPPMSPEVTAALQLEAQRNLWSRSASVFVARSNNLRPHNGPIFGNQVELVPLLQLKGPAVSKIIVVAHTGLGTCGFLPSLNALIEESGGLYVVYSDAASPTAESITETMHPNFLRDPAIIDAWRSAYDKAITER